MAQGKTISQLTGATTVNQQDLFLIYQTGSTLNVAVSALTQNIVNTNFTGGTMMVTGLTTSSSISATTYLNLPYGNGTVNYVPKWTGSTGLGNSTIFDNGSVVAVGYNDLLVNFTVSANTFNLGKGGSTPSRALFMGKSIPSTWIGASSCGQFDFNNPGGDQGVVIRTNAGYVGTGSTPVAGGIISVQGNARGLILAGNPLEENHLVIDRFGKVGVGTNIPVSKFDVSVTADTIGVRISGSSTSDMLRVTQTGSGNAITVEDSSNPDSTPFVVKSDGSVGIGTDSPNRKLTVSGDMESTGIIFCTDVLATDSLQANYLFPDNDSDLNISTRTNTGVRDINLMTGPKPGGVGFVRMKITSGGTIGVNTESPSALFDISSPTGTTVGLRVSGNSDTDMVRITQVGTGHTFVVEDSENPDSNPFVIRNDGKVYMGTYSQDTTSLLNVGGNQHIFGNLYFTGTANFLENAVNSRARIYLGTVGNSWLNNGNLGIGTITPTSRLDVSVTGDTVGLRVSGNSSTDMVRITQTGSGNAFVVEDSSNPDEDSFIITSGGTVGIGVSTPNPFTLNQADGKLHVRSGSSGVTGGTGGGTVVIEASTTNYLQMYSPDENVSGIVFGSTSDAFGAYMRWGHSQGKLQISTANDSDYIELGADNSSFKAYVTNTGLGVNVSALTNSLHVSASTDPVRFEGLQTNTASTKTVIADNNGVLYVENKPKKYVALLTQTGTSAPTAIILENTLGNVTFGYVTNGIYSVTATGLLTTNKTSIVTGGAVCSIDGLTTNTFNLLSYSVPNPANGVLNKSTLEITVYP